jgi:membrane peptidoglycan carboxypeptidase
MAQRRWGRLIGRGLGWGSLTLVIGTGGALAGLLSAPFPTDATVKESGQITLKDARGITYAQITPPETRTPVASLDDVSPCMVKAITAAEDDRFFQHSGVDPLAIGRALVADVTNRRVKEGGSTITQQYVKLVYTGGEKTALRKVREAALAVRLEQHKSKREILRLYLNAVPLGNGLIGVEAAAKDYFGVHAKDLDCAQAALLAGSVSAPSINNPRRAKGANARVRQSYVLNRMIDARSITPEEATRAIREPITLKPPHDKTRPTIAPEYTDEVVQVVKDRLGLGEDAFARGAVTIQTPLDLDLQDAAVKALREVLPDPKDPEAAIIAIDPRNGAVRALSTRRDGGYARGGLDLATSIAPNSGSTVKPFTLAAALETGRYSLFTGAYGPPEVSRSVPGCGKPFDIKNAEKGEGGYFSLRSALEQSVNTVYAPLAIDVGLTKVRDLAVRAGIPAKAFEGAGGACPVYPSQSLGISVAPADLTSGYATLANGGLRYPRRWVDKVTSVDTGETFLDAGIPSGVRAMKSQTAEQVVDAMRGVISRGTGTGARPPGLSLDLFGKTGTTDDFTNAWFVGCNPTLCIGIWMGYDRPYNKDGSAHSMLGVEGVGKVYGGTLPARIFNVTLRRFSENRLRHKLSALPSGSAGSAAPTIFVPQSPAPASGRSPSAKASTRARPSRAATSAPAPPAIVSTTAGAAPSPAPPPPTTTTAPVPPFPTGPPPPGPGPGP